MRLNHLLLSMHFSKLLIFARTGCKECRIRSKVSLSSVVFSFLIILIVFFCFFFTNLFPLSFFPSPIFEVGSLIFNLPRKHKRRHVNGYAVRLFWVWWCLLQLLLPRWASSKGFSCWISGKLCASIYLPFSTILIIDKITATLDIKPGIRYNALIKLLYYP